MSSIKRSSGVTRLLTVLVSLVVSLGAAALVSGLGVASGAPPDTRGEKNTVQVTGTGPNGEKFNGQFTATGPAKENPNPGQPAKPLLVTGQLTGTLTSPGQGQTIPGAQGPGAQQISQTVDMPAAIQQATCQVLNLVLGPLDLNLLGLMVHLDQVVLNITADPAGGILGQLLCSLAGQPPGQPNPSLSQIIAFLTQLLGLFG